ncbi:MAG TPA: CAP domain-containing protein [Thermoleophilaceae bacterium]|jgi:uncharacterized protein YkwD|nr:CAP domain-containing protein [Thermoleophilaceae bacterium]
MDRRSRFVGLVLALAVCAGVAAPAAAAAPMGASVKMLDAVNDFRQDQGLQPYRMSRALSRSSTAFAAWQMRSDYFGHAGSIRAAGNYSSLGEAIAMHTGHRRRIRATVRGWANSPGHRALLLSTNFRDAGAGLARGRLGGASATIWVLQLGRR